jgi:hypothetical protein
MQRPSRCFAKPGPYQTPAFATTPALQRTQERALRPGHETGLESYALFIEIAPATGPLTMNAQTSPTSARQIVWPSVITVISAAILIGAEVFGAAFAGGWALAILFGLDDFGAHILQAALFALGVVIMVAFIRAAQRVEPFTRRA